MSPSFAGKKKCCKEELCRLDHTDFIIAWYKSLQTTNVNIPDIIVVTPKAARTPEQQFLNALILDAFY